MGASGAESYLAIFKMDPATPATYPAKAGLTMQKVNFASEDLGADISSKTSKHIRDDRMTQDVTITGYKVGGGYEYEFQWENSGGSALGIDQMILAMLWCEVWTDNTDGTFTAKNGKFYQPFYIERGHTDVGEFFKFVGMAANIWSLEFKDQDLVNGKYSFMGLGEKVETTPAADTYTAPTTNQIFSTVTNVPEVKINGGVVAGCLVKEWDLEINNNVTGRTGVGTLGACETAAHRLSVTGKLTMYFNDSTMYNKLKNGTAFSFSWTLTDSANNSYKFTLPRVKLDKDKINTEDGDEDVMENASYVALADNTSACAIQVDRIPAP